jgi:16S rRNA (adenine(1408)-N(1))-methyltransferase
MAEASRRAARPATRGGLPNAVFVASGVERLPPELDGLADRVSIRFPWGSLLLGALGLDLRVAASIGRLVRSCGRLEMAVSVVERDGVAEARSFGSTHLERIEAAFGPLRLSLIDASPMSAAEVRASGSTWARRLGAGTDRPAWRIVLRRLADDQR